MSAPDESQRLLLRAVTGRDGDAVLAWQEWSRSTVLHELDPDSQWLLPALDRNLRRLGVPADRLSRYHNVYRHNWYKNHLALHRAAAVVHEQRRQGPVVILGGAAMAMAHYETIGERPFEGVRLLRGAEAEEAPAWRTAPLEWRSIHASSLDPVDQLVEICSRRGDWDSLSGLLWLVDVATVRRGHPAIEWSQVESRAEALGRAEPIEAARRELDAALPQEAVG